MNFSQYYATIELNIASLKEGELNLKKTSFTVSFCLFILFMLSLSTVNAADSFMDVDASNAHHDGIMYLTEENVINGFPDGTFKPYEPIRRSQAAVMFKDALDLETVKFKNVFQDIDKNHEYADAIMSTYDAGIFKGNNGKFNDGSLTREQMASVLVNAYDLKDTDEQITVNLKNVDASHKESVQILSDLEITNQTDNFHPNETVTRGQFATFLYKTIESTKDDSESGDNENSNNNFKDQNVFEAKNHNLYIYGITLGDKKNTVVKKLGEPDEEKADDSDLNPTDSVLVYENLNIHITDDKVQRMYMDSSRKFFYDEFKGKYPKKEYMSEDGNVDYLYDDQSKHIVYAKYENNKYSIRFDLADPNFEFSLENGAIQPVDGQDSSENSEAGDKDITVNNYVELKKALQENNSDSQFVKLGEDIKLSDTIDVNNKNIKVNGNGKTITSTQDKDAFEVKADNVSFENITVKPNNTSSAFLITAKEGFELTDSNIKSKQDLSKGVMIEDNFQGGNETAAITDTTINGPGIGVSIKGGLLTLQGNTIKNTLTGLQITSIEVPKKLEDNSFTNNFEDINTTYVGGVEDDLNQNTFDGDDPKINESEHKEDNDNVSKEESSDDDREANDEKEEPDDEVSKTYPIEQGASLTEVEDFLESNYGNVTTPMGDLELSYEVSHYDKDSALPEGYKVNTRYGDYTDSFLYTIDKYQSDSNENIYRIELDEEDLNETISILKDFQKEIYSVMKYVYSDENLEGSFYDNYYKYPAIKEDLKSEINYGWKNYKEFGADRYDSDFYFVEDWTAKDQLEWEENLK